MSALERNLHERVTRLEASMDAIAKGIEEIKQEMRSLRGEINTRFERIDDRFERIDAQFERIDDRFQHVDSRFDAMYGLMSTWLKWVLGFIFSSWLTMMASFWLKR